MSILPKIIYRFNVISIKNSEVIYTVIEITILSFLVWNQRELDLQRFMRKKNKARGITLHLKVYYKAIVIKILSWPEIGT